MRHLRLLLLSFLAVLAGQAAQGGNIIIDLEGFSFTNSNTITLREVGEGLAKKVLKLQKQEGCSPVAAKLEGGELLEIKDLKATRMEEAVRVGFFQLCSPEGIQINPPPGFPINVEAQLPLKSVGLNKESKIQELIDSLQKKEFSVTAVQWTREDSKGKWEVIEEEDGRAVEDCMIGDLPTKGAENRLRIQLLGPNAGKKEKKKKKVSSSPATPSWLDKLGKGLLCVAVVGGGFLVFKQLFKKPRPAKRRK